MNIIKRGQPLKMALKEKIYRMVNSGLNFTEIGKIEGKRKQTIAHHYHTYMAILKEKESLSTDTSLTDKE